MASDAETLPQSYPNGPSKSEVVGMMQKDTVVYIHNIYIYLFIHALCQCGIAYQSPWAVFRKAPFNGGGFTTTMGGLVPMMQRQ